jgi:hypothetical protein
VVVDMSCSFHHEKERVDGMDAIDPFVLERLRSKSN